MTLTQNKQTEVWHQTGPNIPQDLLLSSRWGKTKSQMCQNHVIWLIYRNSGREYSEEYEHNAKMKSIDMFGILPHHRSGLEDVYSGSRVPLGFIQTNFSGIVAVKRLYITGAKRAGDLGFKETYKVLTFGEGPREREGLGWRTRKTWEIECSERERCQKA